MKRSKGPCPACGRMVFIDDRGMISRHPAKIRGQHQRNAKNAAKHLPPCVGTGEKPAEVL